MSDSLDPIPDATLNDLRSLLKQSQDTEVRRLELRDQAADVQGPLGDLLRAVAAAHEGWLSACELGAVTDAESIRMEAVTDAAVACAEWLQGDR